MKRHILILKIVSICFIALLSSAAYSADSRAGEVEAVISKYFKAFAAKDLKGMVAVSAPSIRVIDYGETFNLDEWNWYMQFNFTGMEGGGSYDVLLTDFSTKVHGDIAYTSFHMGGGEGSVAELGNAVLKRTDGQWRIDLLIIEKGQDWLPWLRDRVKKGQDVSNWYQDYLKENPY